MLATAAFFTKAARRFLFASTLISSSVSRTNATASFGDVFGGRRRRGAEGGDHVAVTLHAVVCDEHVLDGVVLEVDLVHSLLLCGLGSDTKYEFRDVGHA